jgi:hypothetical protein
MWVPKRGCAAGDVSNMSCQSCVAGCLLWLLVRQEPCGHDQHETLGLGELVGSRAQLGTSTWYFH